MDVYEIAAIIALFCGIYQNLTILALHVFSETDRLGRDARSVRFPCIIVCGMTARS